MPFVRHVQETLSKGPRLSKDQISTSIDGKIPNDLEPAEKMVYRTVLELAGTKGSLFVEAWEKASAELGQEVTVRLAQVVGLYLYLGVLTRLEDLPAPPSSPKAEWICVNIEKSEVLVQMKDGESGCKQIGIKQVGRPFNTWNLIRSTIWLLCWRLFTW